VLTANHGPAQLFRNDAAGRNNMLRVATVGSASNRGGVGRAWK
jgi:hypothetical protein